MAPVPNGSGESSPFRCNGGLLLLGRSAIAPPRGGWVPPSAVFAQLLGKPGKYDASVRFLTILLCAGLALTASPARAFTVNTLSSDFSGPWGLAVDGSGNVFVADTGDFELKEITAASGYTQVNGLIGNFGSLTGIAVDGSGNLFLADNDRTQVFESPAAQGHTTLTPWASGFSKPYGFA